MYFFIAIEITVDSHGEGKWHPTPVLLPGKSHGRRSLVGCSPWGLEESDMTERLHFHFSLLCIGEGNGNPLHCSCLENPRDGVAQSRTRLKWLSSSSSSSSSSRFTCTWNNPEKSHVPLTPSPSMVMFSSLVKYHSQDIVTSTTTNLNQLSSVVWMCVPSNNLEIRHFYSSF